MKTAISDRRGCKRGKLPGRRRRYPRVATSFEGHYESPARSMFASGGNLNFRGVFLHTPVPDRPGARATFRLNLPDGKPMLKVRGQVVWSNQDLSRGPLGMGLRFEGLLGWQIKRIAAVMLRGGGFDALPQLLTREPF